MTVPMVQNWQCQCLKKLSQIKWQIIQNTLPIGGWNIVSLKHVNNNFKSSVLAISYCGTLGGECAKPTPASHIYSQLSMADKSSALSGPDFLFATTVKSGQNSKS